MRFVVDRFDKRIKGAFPTVTFPINGNFVVTVPNTVYVSLDPAMDLDDLQSRKAAGLLAYYSAFSDIIFEDFANSNGIEVPVSPDPDILRATISDTAALSFCPFGVSLLPTNGTDPGRLTSATVDLGAPPASQEVLVLWDIFELVNTESYSDGVVQQYYSELSPDGITCEVSLDGGTTWEPVYNNTYTTLTHTGQYVKVRFTNNATYSTKKVWVGSYSLLHN